MAASRKTVDLGTALDLIAQPLVLETLVAIGDDKPLQEALPVDTDGVALDSALQRLIIMGTVRPSTTGPFGCYELTPRGTHLLKLLADLDALIATEGGMSHPEWRCAAEA